MGEDWPRKFILSEIGERLSTRRVAGLRDDAEQCFEMPHALFDGIDVSVRWSTLVARACKRVSVNMTEIGL